MERVCNWPVQRELGWVLDDAVAAVRESGNITWHTTEWRDVQRRAAAASAAQRGPQTSVQLRAPLSDLQVLADGRSARGTTRQLLETAHLSHL